MEWRMRARARVCVTKSTQGDSKLIFGIKAALDRISAKISNGVRDLDLNQEMRLKCGGHEMPIGQYFGQYSQRRIKMIGILRSATKWV